MNKVFQKINRLALLILVVLWVVFVAKVESVLALATEFGVVGAVPSLATDSQKQAAIDKIAELGVGWMRHEFDYAETMTFEHYDAAASKAEAKGIKTLGLLLYPGADRSHEQWQSYVRQIVSHYGSRIPAWEIMNEADNYLSAADYVVYLKEAHAIIKEINPNATVVLTGITSRPETPNFWAGVAAGGGWNYFDVAGLHVYHSGNPEKVNFGGGDLLAEYDRALASLKKNGGGKKIWITETGYKTSEVGDKGQADYLARLLIMTRSVPSIEKIIVYRLFDDAKATYGLTGADLGTRPAFSKYKEVVSALSGKGGGTRLYPQEKVTLDILEGVNGWSTKESREATAGLSSVEGKTGRAMKVDYQFFADKAYALIEKIIAVPGQPEAFAAWFYGDDTKNVWKFRFKDKNGETFQTDLGNLVSGWNYKQFTPAKDEAIVSWDGNGVIDYPVSFNSFVIDRQGGEATASGIVDELAAISSGADLYAFLFDKTVAYWKASGTAGNVELCGAKREFSESPAFATDVSCVDTPKTVAVSSPAAKASPVASPKAAPSTSPSPKPATPTPSPVTSSPSPSPEITPSPRPTRVPADYKAVASARDLASVPVIPLIAAIWASLALIGYLIWRRRKP